MTPGARPRLTALLAASGLWGFAACGAPGANESATADVAPAQAGVPAAGQVAPEPFEAGAQDASEGATLFTAGVDGLLYAQEVELAAFPTTRGRAEALVQKVVEESGTFPENVQVLDVFVSGRGVAVINFTLDLLEGHSGGLHAEELTVYSLSHTLVESIPAIGEVRLLVEGQETETLAGHLDLRSGFGRAPDRLIAE